MLLLNIQILKPVMYFKKKHKIRNYKIATLTAQVCRVAMYKGFNDYTSESKHRFVSTYIFTKCIE